MKSIKYLDLECLKKYLRPWKVYKVPGYMGNPQPTANAVVETLPHFDVLLGDQQCCSGNVSLVQPPVSG